MHKQDSGSQPNHAPAYHKMSSNEFSQGILGASSLGTQSEPIVETRVEEEDDSQH